MPNQPKTQTRTFRIPDYPYFPAKAKAEREGTTVSDKVREWMTEYVEEDGDE
jgi:hypothetical protein